MPYNEFADRAQKILLNKAIDSGEASSTSWITVPTGTTARLASLERRQGAVAFDTTLNSFVVDDGTGFQQIAGTGGGGGASTAADVSFDNSVVGTLSSSDAQSAIDELSPHVTNLTLDSDGNFFDDAPEMDITHFGPGGNGIATLSLFGGTISALSGTSILIPASIPPGLRPAQNFEYPVTLTINGGSRQMGKIVLQPNGAIRFYSDWAGSGFTDGSAITIEPVVLVYPS
jgi:hypothetical protein